jgi:hypothetical protein
MNPAPANSPLPEAAPAAGDIGAPMEIDSGNDPGNQGWPWRKIASLAVFALAVHVTLICFFGTKKQIVPRAVQNVPQLRLADPNDELLALDNPALMAVPNSHDFAAAVWSKVPPVPAPAFHWTEPPRWLPLDPENLGTVFRQFMAGNHFTIFRPDLKPPPQFLPATITPETALPQQSLMKLIGPLAQRRLREPAAVPSQPYNDVIPSTMVQVLVDAAGNVVSATVLPSNNGLQAAEHYEKADQDALAVARQLQFMPAAGLTLGEIIFIWHTIPVINYTNAPSDL